MTEAHFVIQVVDTGSLYDGVMQTGSFMTAQCPLLVIPVPRHWDPENLIVYYTTFSIKSWIPDWNDITGALEFLFQYLYISHASEQILAKMFKKFTKQKKRQKKSRVS